MATQTETAVQDQIINGVNVTSLGQTIGAVKQDPQLAEFRFRAKNRWVDGGYNRVSVDGFYGTNQEIVRDKPFELDADEPPVLLGQDKGANPVEYLLAALSACMTTTLAYHGAAQGIEIEAIESEYEGDLDLKGFLGLDPEVRKGYKQIRVKFKVKGDADEKAIEDLVRNSPVFDTVVNPTPVVISVVKG